MAAKTSYKPSPLPITESQRAAARAAQKAHWQEALNRARQHYEEAKEAGTLIPAEEIDRALDKIRGRAE